MRLKRRCFWRIYAYDAAPPHHSIWWCPRLRQWSPFVWKGHALSSVHKVLTARKARAEANKLAGRGLLVVLTKVYRKNGLWREQVWGEEPCAYSQQLP